MDRNGAKDSLGAQSTIDGYVVSKLLVSSFFILGVCAARMLLLHLSLDTTIIETPSNSVKPFVVGTIAKRVRAIAVYGVLLYSC